MTFLPVPTPDLVISGTYCLEDISNLTAQLAIIVPFGNIIYISEKSAYDFKPNVKRSILDGKDPFLISDDIAV